MKLIAELCVVSAVAGIAVVAWMAVLMRRERPTMTDEDAEVWNGRERRSTQR